MPVRPTNQRPPRSRARSPRSGTRTRPQAKPRPVATRPVPVPYPLVGLVVQVPSSRCRLLGARLRLPERDDEHADRAEQQTEEHAVDAVATALADESTRDAAGNKDENDERCHGLL